MAKDESSASLVVARQQAPGQPELTNECKRCGRIVEKAIGSALADISIDVFGSDVAAGPWTRLEHYDIHVRSALLECPGYREPGNSRARDRDSLLFGRPHVSSCDTKTMP